MPPSVNRLYRVAHNRKILTKDALNYLEHVKRVIADNLHYLQNFPIGDKELCYAFDLTVYLEKLENPGWFEFFERGPKAGQRKAQTRFKEIDVDNRIKFVQDCVIKTLGIPSDAQIFEGAQRKKQSKCERAIVKISLTDRAQYFEEESA